MNPLNLLAYLAEYADSIMGGVNLVFFISLLGTVRNAQAKVPLSTSLPTALGLFVLSATLFALGLLWSSGILVCTGLLWAFIALRRRA